MCALVQCMVFIDMDWFESDRDILTGFQFQTGRRKEETFSLPHDLACVAGLGCLFSLCLIHFA